MAKRTARRTGAPAKRAPTTSYRFPPATLARIEKLADALDTDKTTAIDIAVFLAADRLGLLRRDIAAAVDELERVHGPEASLAAEITVADDRGHLATVTVNGEPLDGWSADLSIKPDGSEALLVVRHDESGSMFPLGIIKPPVVGAGYDLPVRHLPEVAMAPERGQDPAELRREIRDSLRLRRMARVAFDEPDEDPDSPEEAPLDQND
jgi:hypothetical protein